MSHATTRLTASTSAVIDAKTSIRAASKDRPNGTANDAAAKWRHNVPSHRIKEIGICKYCEETYEKDVDRIFEGTAERMKAE